MSEYAEILRATCEARRKPEIAKKMSAYLKDRFASFGIKSPERRELQKIFFQQLPLKDPDFDYRSLVKELWAFPERESQYFAQELFAKQQKKFHHPDDLADIEYLLTHKDWWDSVDYIASTILGFHCKKYPEQIPYIVERFTASNHLWLQRSTLIFQLKYKDDVDFDLLKKQILTLKGDKEFFIQKAIGWSLRQYSKFNPEEVNQFLSEHEFSNLARREGSKYLNV